MRLHFLSALVLLSSASLAAHAGTVTQTFSFVATDFSDVNPAGPAGPAVVSGEFTLTYDPTLTYTDATAGLTVDSFSYPFSTPVTIGFDYAPGEDYFLFGGTLNSVNTVDGGTNDYYVAFGSFPYMALANAEAGSYALFTTATVTESTSPLPGASATPEPSSLILLGTGALAIAGSLRRRLFA